MADDDDYYDVWPPWKDKDAELAEAVAKKVIESFDQRAKTIETLLARFNGLEGRVKAAEDLLRRMRQWDRLADTNDGFYWAAEIAKFLEDKHVE